MWATGEGIMQTRFGIRLGAGLILIIALAACGGSDEGAAIDRFEGPGPRLALSPEALDEVLTCEAPRGDTEREATILLVHGTALTAEESWPRTYGKVLPELGWRTCSVTLPERSLGDIQIATETVVAAVRRLHRRHGLPVSLIGHSQGGLEIRWATRWWPDLGDLIDDAIMIATPNHGTLVANVLCLQTLVGCTAAVQQQRPGSAFLEALNATPLDARVDFTSIYSLTDDIVTTLPPDFSPAVEGAANILVQSVCPLRPVLHIPMLTDAVVYAAVLDALENPGPADPARIPARTCLSLVAEGMTPGDFLLNTGTYLPALLAVAGNRADDEPALADYVVP
jgi:triacylglycerol lipase